LKSYDSKLVSQTLINNADLFAWTTSNMHGVSLDIITHRFSVYKEAKPIAQKKHKMGKESVLPHDKRPTN